jgi:hypothetical protein
MQLLDCTAYTSAKTARPDRLQQEIYNRTFWGCFILDRLVFSGKHQPLSLPLQTVDTHWPIGDQDYAFCRHDSQPRTFAIQESTPPTLDSISATIIRGFEIWTQIHHWIITGGRRQQAMLLPENAPWAETSLWSRLYGQLQDWRRSQDVRLLYPGTLMAAHVSLGKGEAVAFVNLVYHIR